MSPARLGVLVFAAAVSACDCGSTPPQQCPEECQNPPASQCLSSDTLQRFTRTSACGQPCAWSALETQCAHGCADAACLEADGGTGGSGGTGGAGGAGGTGGAGGSGGAGGTGGAGGGGEGSGGAGGTGGTGGGGLPDDAVGGCGCGSAPGAALGVLALQALVRRRRRRC